MWVTKEIRNITGLENNEVKFDFTDGWIYWTHAKKCIPESNHKPSDKSCCRRFLLKELQKFQNLKAIVVFGQEAYKTLWYVLKTDEDYPKKSYGHVICEAPEGGYIFTFSGRTLQVFPFFHPSPYNKRTAEIKLSKNPQCKEKYIQIIVKMKNNLKIICSKCEVL